MTRYVVRSCYNPYHNADLLQGKPMEVRLSNMVAAKGVFLGE